MNDDEVVIPYSGITHADIKQRLPKMLVEFAPHNVYKPVIACCNVDTSKLPKPPGKALPQPSILHTVTGCEICDEEVWIGPNQNLARQIGTVTCYICVAILSKYNAVPPITLSLNQNESDIPRREST